MNYNFKRTSLFINIECDSKLEKKLIIFNLI